VAQLLQRLRQIFPDVSIISAATPEEVVRRASVIITASASAEPLIQGAWLRPGQHITALGADDPQKCELDSASLLRADRLIVDSLTQTARHGDIYRALSRGELSTNNIHGELGQVLAGILPGRTTDDEITIVKLIGLGIQDLAAAEVALARFPHNP
jgi:ornithine cyclodeaminase